MKFTLPILLFAFSLFAQQQITLNEIWSGTYAQEHLSSIVPMQNPNYYTTFEYDQAMGTTKVVKHHYNNESDIEVLVSAENLPIRYFENYQLSANETKLILGAQMQSRYRYTQSGLYFVYDIKTKSLQSVFDKPVFNPSFSPDANKVAFVFENNLYVKNLELDSITQLTFDGKENAIINGLADWVYEEEFELLEAYKWSPDGNSIAFLRFDESKVREYTMSIYGEDNYPYLQTFKYPKAGEVNSKVTAHIVNVSTKEISKVDLGSANSYYIADLLWVPNTVKLVLKTLNRKQNELDLVQYNATLKKSNLLYHEQNNTYVEYHNHVHFLDDASFVLTSEQDGYNHIYHYNKKGELLKQLTKGNWTVTDFYGFNNQEVYFQRTHDQTIERQIAQVSFKKGKHINLSQEDGTHTGYFNSDFSLFIDAYSNVNTPISYNLVSVKDDFKHQILLDNTKLKAQLSNYQLPTKEFLELDVNGYSLNAYIIKPVDFNVNKKYPVLLYQYSGPNSQTVKNSWHSYNDYWHYMLSQKGYIIACVDGRGTGMKGQEFKTLTQNQLGKLEAQDQIAFAKYLGQQSYVDAKRIGIWGWSYGGTTALNSLFLGENTFAMAIAVAPVTNWRYYDTIYTERFMDTPQNNPSGYDDYSPNSYAHKLQGKLLLVHGTADDNVHYQNAAQLQKALVQANKDFEFATYSDKNHGIYGGNTRLHLFSKMTNFILNNL